MLLVGKGEPMINTTFILFLICILYNPFYTSAQGLFEDAISEDTKIDSATKSTFNIDINGYLKTAIYVGESIDENKSALFKSGYGEVSLSLAASHKIGSVFAEIRAKKGYALENNIQQFTFREGYISTSAGLFDFKIGQQIVVWGRADGINPTNNITPQNMIVFSQEVDDMRESNFLARLYLNTKRLRFDGIWIPFFLESKLPIESANLPIGINFIDDSMYPDHSIKNSSYAIRCTFEGSKADGSISYFNGYNSFPGINAIVSIDGFLFFKEAYRMHVIGGDFSTAIGSFGISGETGFRLPYENYEIKEFLPYPEVKFVFGLDIGIGNINLLMQYIGKNVFNYKVLTMPILIDHQNQLAIQIYQYKLASYELEKYNRMLLDQQNEYSNSIMARIETTFFYETIHMECSGMYMFSSNEYVIATKISYDISDAISIIAGGRYVDGSKNTLLHMANRMMSNVFVEMKYSF